MAKSARRFTILLVFASFWLLTAIEPAYGKGSRDTDLARADELIKENKYDEATRILTEYARKHPERFDKSQQRLRVISKSRDEFDRIADDLIFLLLNTPDESEEILALTMTLREMETENSPVITSFLNRIFEIAQFNVYRNRLRDILERGRAALDRGDSEGALRIYAGGMEFMRSEFFTAGYGDSIENEVRRETERVNSVIESFRSVSTGLGTASTETVRAVNTGNMTTIQESTARLAPAIERFINLRQELSTASAVFERILTGIQARNPEQGDRNHLAFVFRVIQGRSGETIQEGMFGAFNTYWDNSINPILSAIAQNGETLSTTGLAAFNNKRYPEATAALQRIGTYSALTSMLFDRNRALNRGGRLRTVTLLDENILSSDIPLFTRLKSMTEAANHLIQAAAVAGRMDTAVSQDNLAYSQWRAGTISATAAMNNENQLRTTFTGMRREIEGIIASASRADTAINSAQDHMHLKNAITSIQAIRTALVGHEYEPILRYYSIGNTDLRNSLTARREEQARARRYLEGERRVLADGSFTTDYFPAEALQTFNAMIAAIDDDIARGNTMLTYYRNETNPILTDTDIVELVNNSRTVIQELTALRNQNTAAINTARSRATQAEAFRQEGERLFREAQTAYQRNDFEAARDRLTRASERINNSLAIQASESYRRTWDTQSQNLGMSINAAENERIIAEVRNLVNTARIAYFEGNFQQAEDNLVRARNRWRITNPDENDEIIYWLGIVRGAMSARSGRVIPHTAPLYPEMSQLLSEARRNFDEGVRLINAGSRSQGLDKFNQARQQTREVKLMFPVNQEAGILELRMEQYTDPQAFNASYEQRLRAAIAGTKQRSMESFADLQNLAEINPRYPGIRGIINQAEIDMGFRPPPPNPRDLARSRELTAAASRILEENNTALFEVAIAQLNEAISLNPENIEATRIKDRILNRAGSSGSVVLSSEDEAEYQRAVREFQAGNNLVAFAIVDKLLQNPRNRNITKLVELHRRIQLELS